MRAVVQRVSHAQVTVDQAVVGAIEVGLVVLLGVEVGDTTTDADYLCRKILNLRIFPDEQGKMNHSLLEISGQMLVVSQFTLLGDCRQGRRPSYTAAAPPAMAEALYQHFVAQAHQTGITVATGKFQAMMAVDLTNQGPVTLLLDSKGRF
jgi:D-aminoacyl-tRNA deacylase